jgi:hypothetical protein
MAKFLLRVVQIVTRKLIDWLMSLWLWANKRERAIQDKEDYERN